MSAKKRMVQFLAVLKEHNTGNIRVKVSTQFFSINFYFFLYQLLEFLVFLLFSFRTPDQFLKENSRKTANKTYTVDRCMNQKFTCTIEKQSQFYFSLFTKYKIVKLTMCET
jgi:hypothetical protein